MPYFKGVSERITRILNRAGAKTFYSRSQKLRGDILSQPKDPLSKKHTACVYSIPCSCGQQYIGQTKRPLRVRVVELKRATEQGKAEGSALAEHAHCNNHTPLWADVTSIVKVKHLGMRLIREALEIRVNEKSTINRMDGKDVSHM
ncbi:hypothetical protein HOLleu_32019 [Holothuria leucospilota]|uniref:Uncharacterized protein n=1 Tax=Holothuria leucospilota TaxID=206669 RepID=A0A9Q0YR71_HOLLE|nr:hypothetical protein HOLleu_32019 [Holothuria leucospilota]